MTARPWSLRPEFAHLLNATLVWAVCGKCKRGSQWSKLPAKCPCGGRVKRPEA